MVKEAGPSARSIILPEDYEVGLNAVSELGGDGLAYWRRMQAPTWLTRLRMGVSTHGRRDEATAAKAAGGFSGCGQPPEYWTSALAPFESAFRSLRASAEKRAGVREAYLNGG